MVAAAWCADGKPQHSSLDGDVKSSALTGCCCAGCCCCCRGQVNLNSVWSGIGVMENNLLGAAAETRLRVEELEDR